MCYCGDIDLMLSCLQLRGSQGVKRSRLASDALLTPRIGNNDNILHVEKKTGEVFKIRSTGMIEVKSQGPEAADSDASLVSPAG